MFDIRKAPLVLAAMTLTLSSAPVAAYENDMTYPVLIVSGSDFAAGDAYEGYAGIFYALNRDLDREGVILRVLGSMGSFEYDVPPPGTTVDGDFWQGDVMIGYQWVRHGLEIGAYVGVDFQDYDLSPDDPDNPVNGSETGFKVALDIESDDDIPAAHYFALHGAYSTAFDTYFVLGRVGRNFDRFTIGPEVWAYGDETGDAQRVGAFLKFDLPPIIDRASTVVSLSGGYQFVDDNGGGYKTSSFGEEGGYFSINFRTAFGESRSAGVPLK